MPEPERFVYPFGYTGKRYLLDEKSYRLYRIITYGGVFLSLLASLFLKDYKFGLAIAAALILSTLVARLILAQFGHIQAGPASVPDVRPRHPVGRLGPPAHIKIGTLFLSSMLLLSLYHTISTGQGIAYYQVAIGCVWLIGAFRWWGGG